MNRNLFYFYFASVSWSVAFIVFLLSVLKIDVQSRIPFIWILHVGIFVAWIPWVFKTSKNKMQLKTNLSLIQKIKRLIISELAPTWLVILVILSYINFGGNFIWHMINFIGGPEIEKGQFILASKGDFIKTITEKEYHYLRAEELKIFSSCWLLMYGVAMARLFEIKETE